MRPTWGPPRFGGATGKIVGWPMTPEEALARRRYRYQNDPEYRERHKLQSRQGVRKMRALDPAVIAQQQRYAELVAVQGEECAICGGQEQRLKASDGLPHRLAIDHDHATGATRALLCSSCNLMLGTSGDSPERLEAGARYLREHSSHNASPAEVERAQ